MDSLLGTQYERAEEIRQIFVWFRYGELTGMGIIFKGYLYV